MTGNIFFFRAYVKHTDVGIECEGQSVKELAEHFGLQHDGDAEIFPGATKEEIASVMMQDLVGDYDTPSEVPEWAWVEREASFHHSRNGQDGIWEFVLNLSHTFENVPVKIKPALEQARSAQMGYLIIHQGT